MQVEMTEFVEDAVTVVEEDDIVLLASLRGRAGCVRSWSERATETGRLVSLYAIVVLRPGESYDLPAAQAEKLIGIGYARAVS